MAGLGEVCTHIAAILFYLETSSWINGASLCTQQKCQWVIPAFQKEIPYLPVADIDFTSARAKKKKLDEAIENDSSRDSQKAMHPVDVVAPEPDELKSFLQKVSQCNSRPGILSLVPEFQGRYIPKSSLPSFPRSLQDLYNPALAKASYPDLLTSCGSVRIELSEEMVHNVEEATRAQSDSRLWYRYRAGRVTASKMKRVCSTSLAMPSQRLIKEICYPEAFRFTTRATCWGCEHERAARERYAEQMAERHEKFSVANSGLVLNPEWTHLGASPDGIVCCTCCGRGALEIKCSYCHRHNSVEDVARDSSSCLKTSDSNDSLHLDHEHAYYFQVQTQIFVCQVQYSDFCVCTFPPGSAPDIHIERIYPDTQLWQFCIDKSTQFFQTCLLPELLGRWNSRGPSVTAAINDNQASTSNSDLAATDSSQASNSDSSQVATGSSQASIATLDSDPAPSSTSSDVRLYCY